VLIRTAKLEKKKKNEVKTIGKGNYAKKELIDGLML